MQHQIEPAKEFIWTKPELVVLSIQYTLNTGGAGDDGLGGGSQ